MASPKPNVAISAVALGVALFILNQCTAKHTANIGSVKNRPLEVWLTKGDGSVRLQRQSPAYFGTTDNTLPEILVDGTQQFQTVDGFGFTLTGGSVAVINGLPPTEKSKLLSELFGHGASSISVSYLRLSIGASDLNSEVFSYDDVPAGHTDEGLKGFSLSKDRALISMLKEILAINPKIKIIAAPWSAPTWMKDNGDTKGGHLRPEFYPSYARYFVRYIQEMGKLGIPITAVTPQNEPLNPNNNPSLVMTAEMQKDFIKNNLGSAFLIAGISTKIVLYDHNCNRPDYPMDILKDPGAAKFVDGSAFHLYEGDIAALSAVHAAFPSKNIYFTEQWTGSKGNFCEDLNWLTKNVIIGSMRNWSRTALTWNLANDEDFGPHTPGGCTECKGAVTVTKTGTVERNVQYYIIAQASKFVPLNSVRLASTEPDGLANVAFRRPDGKVVIVVQNDKLISQKFNVHFHKGTAAIDIPAKSVETLIF